MEIRSLGYLRFEATDLDAWERFAIEGLDVGADRDGDTLCLRVDDHPSRIVLHTADTDRLTAAGWEVAGRRALDELVARLDRAGIAVKDATADELADRRVEAMVHVEDPCGNHLEIYANPALDHQPLTPRFGTTFVTGTMGLGHVVLPAADLDAAMGFYEELLGFQHRDSMRIPGLGPDGGDAWIRFLGCNTRHHSLALFGMAIPTGIVHLMIEVATLDDVGRGLDRVVGLGAPISMSLGRHTNDHMVSFYVATPGGFDLEYGTGGLLVDPDTWITSEITAVSFWGHRYGGGA